MGEKWPVKFSHTIRLPRNRKGSLTCRKSATRDRRLYFPSEGRHAEDFFRPKNRTASAGFEPANLGTRGQHVFRRSFVG
jgi:spore germination cell wall hydrolase CwlJ-like protein